MVFKWTQKAPEVIFEKPEVTLLKPEVTFFMTGNDIYGSGSTFGVTGSEIYGTGNDLNRKKP